MSTTLKTSQKPSSLLDCLANISWTTHRPLFLVLFALLAVVLLAPVWTVQYPPLIDYPNHLASAFVLAHLHDPRFHFSQYYAANWNVGPYLTMDLILVGLQRFLPVTLAARTFLSLCLLAVPPAIWFFLRQANPGQDSLAFWSLLLCCNMYFFLYGFLNLQLGFALCFLFLGFWLKYLNELGPMLWSISCGLSTLLYFTHIVAFAMAGFIVVCYLILDRTPLGKVFGTALLFVPGIVCYFYWKAADVGQWAMHFYPVSAKLLWLPATILGYSPALDFLTVVAIVLCIFWVSIDNSELHRNRPWLGILLCSFALYLILPGEYGTGSMLARRLLPFLFVIGLAVFRIGRRAGYVAAAAILLFTVRAGNLQEHFVDLQPHMEKLADSFSVIPRNSRVFSFIHRQTDAGQPEDQFWAYGVIRRGWVSPYLFHDRGVQPIEIKIKTYTLGRYAPFVRVRKPIIWSQIQSDYDYVWAYGAPEFSARFAAIGQLVFKADGLEVYKMTKLPPGSNQKTQAADTARPQKVTRLVIRSADGQPARHAFR